ncbi:YcjF family protein [Rhodoplanes sp. Z2-YC6860]|uniref:YcjF family protein n=1 Tax=Rhodoplanes sp. Z2-YC6860 TaxID=674703 RepID=UPI00083220B6|nr:DUF697 domain-containing protein [Rhodoplanes sp. Z2-YC6860]
MNKKKLPKAVLRTAEDMRSAADRTETTPHPVDLNEKPAAPSANQRPAADNVIELIPKTESAVADTIVVSAAHDTAAALRRRKAVAIVERHANWSAVGGVIPVPIANAAAITTLMVRMIKQLSALYGVPFEQTRTRAAVVGLMGGVLPTGLATIATSTLMYFVPGYGMLSLAVSSVTSSAYARSIGQLYIEHFEIGATQIDFHKIVLR